MYVGGMNRESLHNLHFSKVGRVFTLIIFASTFVGSAVLAQSPRAVGQTSEYVPGELIVKLRGSSSSVQSQAFIGRAVSAKSMTLKDSWTGLNMHHFSLRPGQSVESAVIELNQDPSVEYAEPNYIVHKQDVSGVEDTMTLDEARQRAAAASVRAASGENKAEGSDESAMSTSNQFSSNSMVQTTAPINEPSTWNDQTAGKAPTVVAVIDTGIDFNHTVFTQTGVIWTNPNETLNGIDDDNNGYVDDLHGWNFVSNNNTPQDDAGHGSHVSGIILGVSQNIFAAQLQPAAIRIMPLKFLDSTGSGATSDAIKAIYYAANNGARVMNNSWGGGSFSSSLIDAIAYAYGKSAVFVAAAGNATNDNDQTPTYPANYNVPNIMSIAATDSSDVLASFSNYGVQTVHMASPGVSVYSTTPNNTISSESGTSMATPFVSGVAALMLRENPGMSGYQIKTLIFGGSTPISDLTNVTVTRSRVDTYSALSVAKSTAANSYQPAYNVSAYDRSPASSGGGGCGLVGKVVSDMNDGNGSGPQRNVGFFALLVILAAPIFVSLMLRKREGKNLRRYQRYEIDSQVRLKFGDRELLGQVSSISLGGVQLNTDAWLDNGGIVKMSIRSPDGRDEIEVEGCVVWSEEKKRYGVAFSNAEETTLQSIARWTQGLLKT